MAGNLTRCFEVILGSGRIKERIHIGISRPQGILDIVARDRVVFDRRANEIVERTFALDQPGHRRVARRAAIGIDGGLTQVRGHVRDEFDGRRAAQDAGRDAAAERRMGGRDAHDLLQARNHEERGFGPSVIFFPREQRMLRGKQLQRSRRAQELELQQEDDDIKSNGECVLDRFHGTPERRIR